MSYIQHDAVLTPLPYGQNPPYITPLREYTHSVHVQPSQHLIYPTLNGTPCQEPPEVLYGAGIYSLIHAAGADVHQTHIPYRNYSLQQLQSPYHAQVAPSVHTQLEDMVRNSRELWFSIAPVRGLPGPIRIFVVIHHMSTWFRTRFLEEPSLSLFMNGLSNNKEMRPIRNVNGLQCKACCLRLGIATAVDQDKESYSLPQLVKHFHERHIKQSYAIGAPVLNWCIDMIHLPDLGVLYNLGRLINMDNQRFALISSALSGADLDGLQLHPSQFSTTPLHLSHSTPSYNHHFAAVHLSSQRARLPQPNIQHMEILRDKSQGDFKTHNVNKDILKGTKLSLCSVELTDSSMTSKLSKPRAGHQYINEASANTMTTSNTNFSQEVALVQRPLSPIDPIRSPGRGLPKMVENDEDDEFDLLAGLESQLARQAELP